MTCDVYRSTPDTPLADVIGFAQQGDSLLASKVFAEIECEIDAQPTRLLIRLFGSEPDDPPEFVTSALIIGDGRATQGARPGGLPCVVSSRDHAARNQ